MVPWFGPAALVTRGASGVRTGTEGLRKLDWTCSQIIRGLLAVAIPPNQWAWKKTDHRHANPPTVQPVSDRPL